ncbi:hypothetical protein [uncultured Sneathiella sp.]|jgi:hypothetical protein|uniref:hypothetical protein n=1 Tax=uncultured Sneathiella sp. TaxID=879315 RepID=UPI0030D785FD|tara:strand:+ start:550 stop:870 length:321 start_codon:yes stop_codon:yes gene_type:complete
MTEFSTDAAGFAALTISELILQQCVINGLFTAEEARRLLETAAARHEGAAHGPEEKIALNRQSAELIRALSSGLEPLLSRPQAKAEKPAPEKKPATPRPTWVRFPD